MNGRKIDWQDKIISASDPDALVPPDTVVLDCKVDVYQQFVWYIYQRAWSLQWDWLEFSRKCCVKWYLFRSDKAFVMDHKQTRIQTDNEDQSTRLEVVVRLRTAAASLAEFHEGLLGWRVLVVLLTSHFRNEFVAVRKGGLTRHSLLFLDHASKSSEKKKREQWKVNKKIWWLMNRKPRPEDELCRLLAGQKTFYYCQVCSHTYWTLLATGHCVHNKIGQ